MKFLEKIIQYGILLLVFLIPWQARWIISGGEINGGPWEYGTQSLYATEILLALILVLLIIRFFVEAAAARRLGEKKKTPQRGRLYKSIGVLFLIYAGISVFWAIDKNVALIHWRWLVEAGILMALVRLEGSRNTNAPIRMAIIISAAIQAMWGIGQFLMQSIPASTILGIAQQSADVLGASVVETMDGRWLRAYGSFPHPNMLGGWLVLGLVVIIRKIQETRYKQIQISNIQLLFLYASFIVILFGLLATFSRSAWLAFGVFTIFWFIKEMSKCHSGLDPESRSKNKNWIPAFAGMTLIVAVVSIFIAIFPQPFLTRLNNTSRLEYKSTSERQASLSEGWQIIKKHPLLGVGVGNYGLAVHRDIDSTQPAYYYQPVHNVFLLIWAELGLIGLLFILLIVFLSLRPRSSGGSNPDNALNIVSSKGDIQRDGRIAAVAGTLPRNDMIFVLPLIVILLFDHYPWSLYSGLMISALYLANISRK